MNYSGIRWNAHCGKNGDGRTGGRRNVFWQFSENCLTVFFNISYIFLLWFAGFSLACRRRCWHNIDGLVSLLVRVRDEHTINIIGKSVLRRRRCAVDRPPEKVVRRHGLMKMFVSFGSRAVCQRDNTTIRSAFVCHRYIHISENSFVICPAGIGLRASARDKSKISKWWC